MYCPKCSSRTRVLEKRHTEMGARRRMECVCCGARYTSIEQIVREIDDSEAGTAKISDLVDARVEARVRELASGYLRNAMEILAGGVEEVGL